MKATDIQKRPNASRKESFATSLVLSAAAHGILILCLIGGAWLWGSPKYYKPSAVTVTLVDAPLSIRPPESSGPGTAASAANRKPTQDQASAAAASKPPSPKPVTAPMRVVTPPKENKPPATRTKRSRAPKVQKPTRKPTKKAVSPAKPRRSTRKRARPPKRRPTEASQPRNTVTKPAQRRTGKTASAAKTEQARPPAVERRLATLRERFGSGAAGEAAVETAEGLQEVRMRAYQELVRDQVIDAWILPLPPEEAQTLQATALLTVHRDGQIARLELIESSGNPLFDDSLLRAIKQVAPLPALPEDYGGKVLEVEMRFRAGGT